MPTPSQSEREALRRRFSEAAKSLSELYRDATHSYDAGYRDALHLLQRYILIASSGNTSTPNFFSTVSGASCSTDRRRNANGSTTALSSQLQQKEGTSVAEVPQVLDVTQLLGFIRNALKRHDVLSAASRGLARRRKRSPHPAVQRTDSAAGEGGFDTTDSNGNGYNCLRGYATRAGRRIPMRRLHSPLRRDAEGNELLLLGEVDAARSALVDLSSSDDDVVEKK
ncbi:unnamed protein product [Trypanosoma congolense IL3000]|uniref:WGS project CAEQ00000000 data, annotated contig 1408 n=1 Tax=Trypanosoma congolense (strain IL3000) TaxID=1068625 RepID=F9W5Z8_TRYCI|nr:unnamed protein product [Trypanosoma congolense IL3000]